jgi:hypothetical protein
MEMRYKSMLNQKGLFEAGLLDPEDDKPLLKSTANNSSNNTNESGANESKQKEVETQQEIPAKLTPELLALRV